jgi:hypothetical protein
MCELNVGTKDEKKLGMHYVFKLKKIGLKYSERKFLNGKLFGKNEINFNVDTFLFVCLEGRIRNGYVRIRGALQNSPDLYFMNGP